MEIDPKIFPALKVEAVIRGISPKELVNQMILSSLSSRAKEFLKENEPPLKETPMFAEKVIKKSRPNNKEARTISIPFHKIPGHKDKESVRSIEVRRYNLDEVPKQDPLKICNEPDTEKPKN